jgi:transposase
MTRGRAAGAGGRLTSAWSGRSLEADSPRVRCPEHGVVAAQVSWARHGAGHTYAFDDTAAWLITHCSKSAVRELLRIAWRTVGSIVTRVVADAEAKTDRFANLRRIGVDEIKLQARPQVPHGSRGS